MGPKLLNHSHLRGRVEHLPKRSMAEPVRACLRQPFRALRALSLNFIFRPPEYLDDNATVLYRSNKTNETHYKQPGAKHIQRPNLWRARSLVTQKAISITAVITFLLLRHSTVTRETYSSSSAFRGFGLVLKAAHRAESSVRAYSADVLISAYPPSTWTIRISEAPSNRIGQVPSAPGQP